MGSLHWLALVALVVAVVCTSSVGVHAADCSNVDYTKPPAKIKSTASYSAKAIKAEVWKAYMDAIDCIGKQEGAFCPMITRMAFHDGGAVDEQQGPNGSGADGTVLTGYLEGISAVNTQHREAPLVRSMLNATITEFKLSWADGLWLAALVCSNTLGSGISIQDVCAQKGAPFLVGRLDGVVPYANVGGDLPSKLMGFDGFIAFWNNLSSKQTDAKYKLDLTDAVALMGSHALNVPHGCTQGPAGQRNRVFDNAYYKDMLSGDHAVFLNPQSCVGCPGNPPGERGESAGCKFQHVAIRQRNKILKDQVRKARHANKDVLITPFEPPFIASIWVPDPKTRAPCTGTQCKCCSAADIKPGSSRPYCVGRKVGECFWPYTPNDAFMAQGVQQFTSAEAITIRKAYTLFKDNLNAFREAYAVALCKLSHVGTRYGTDGPVDLSKKVGNYIGKCANLNAMYKGVVHRAFQC